ncbi:MAG: hypothetical protein AB1705_12575 [Verrucomicrobiota bacterium]
MLKDIPTESSFRLLDARTTTAKISWLYLDFLPAAFTEHGLPLELYVDCHSLFFPQRPDALTQLGAALHFYGISLRCARVIHCQHPNGTKAGERPALLLQIRVH